jgi:hypothetical protein
VLGEVLVLGGILAYVGCRLWLTLATVRADRSGDAARAQTLRERAFHLLLGTISVVAAAVARAPWCSPRPASP